jgi:dipeptidyl aminopeptidase/acylaminoacyl peptidase
MVYELPEDEEEKKALPNRSIASWTQDNFIYVSYSEKDQWNRGIQRFNVQNGEFEDLMTSSDLYGSWRFSEMGDVITYNKSDGDAPNNLFVNNADFTAEKQLTDLNPWVKDKKWTRSELITYRNVDGNEMKGILYYPVDYDPNKKYPLVLEVYETFFNNGYRSSMNLIANQGYFGLRPSVELEQGYPGEAWMKGVTSAINKLVDEGKVDNDKVGVHGTSYGGYATSLLITQTDRFAAAINISGKVNIISFLGDSPKIGTRNYAAAEVGQDRIGGSFWDEPLKYFQTSAVFFADRIKTPHLLLSGEGDWNVPGTNTRELYYALRRLGKEVTWVNYMRGGHGAGWASVESDYHDQWNRMFDFYKEHFNPEKKKEGAGSDVETDQGY